VGLTFDLKSNPKQTLWPRNPLGQTKLITWFSGHFFPNQMREWGIFFLNFYWSQNRWGNFFSFFFPNFSICFHEFLFVFALSLLHLFPVVKFLMSRWILVVIYFTLPLILMSYSFSYSFIIIFFIKQDIYEIQEKIYSRNYFTVFNVHTYFCKKESCCLYKNKNVDNLIQSYFVTNHFLTHVCKKL